MVLANLSFSHASKDTVHIDYLCSRSGQGHGTRLMISFLAYALQRFGVLQVHLISIGGSRKFYRKLGFKDPRLYKARSNPETHHNEGSAYLTLHRHQIIGLLKAHAHLVLPVTSATPKDLGFRVWN